MVPTRSCMNVYFRRARATFRWWNLGIAVLIIFALFHGLEIRSDIVEFKKEPRREPANPGSIMNSVALLSGELPGYSGWARSERTLAGFFSITSYSTPEPRSGDDFSVSVQCSGHEDCEKASSLFFLRAYGPSVISGIVENKGGGLYTMKFRPMDPGIYTIEVVLSFSNPLAFELFPLPDNLEEPGYEGYLLPGFPFKIDVGSNNDRKASVNSHCSFDQLVEDSADSARSKARWNVISKANGQGYHSRTMNDPVSEAGYKANTNSIGIQMSYDYSPNCTLIPSSTFEEKGLSHPFHKCSEKELKVIFIGDSVMRVQWNRFDELVTGIPYVTTDYINLYGGYRRCERFGPDIKTKLQTIYEKAPNAAKAIIFNTGLHDIHRLCGREWVEDRTKYLDPGVLASNFSCIFEYRAIVKDFADLIYRQSSDLKIFQSSTAAWPKYGNYGIQWSFDTQKMPLDPSFVSPFNDVAYDVLKAYSDKIQIMDGFWITHPRPDNREIGDIGNKLSHPGLEVQGAMARIWSMLILERVC
eukprot:scaffold1062_cov130-Cylindrotheca_fusiformis.AAC.19